ncbi:MAG: class I SAM-dependent methyltransferase [Candidatus Acidiferrales bacterium]
MTETPWGAEPKSRFTTRVGNYVRYRPGYPAVLLDLLHEAWGLTPETVIADVGSGTGLLSRLFLENGNEVFGIEPNAAMREGGEAYLAQFREFRFHSVTGSAEGTTLPDASVDAVVAGQAFHWFEPVAARAEFQRILRRDGWVALIWNDRMKEASAFSRDYERLLQKFASEYGRVRATYPTRDKMTRFFGPTDFREDCVENGRLVDYEGLRGALLSSSYAPDQGHPQHAAMIEQLARIFDQHHREGRVKVGYQTRMYSGRLG